MNDIYFVIAILNCVLLYPLLQVKYLISGGGGVLSEGLRSVHTK